MPINNYYAVVCGITTSLSICAVYSGKILSIFFLEYIELPRGKQSCSCILNIHGGMWKKQLFRIGNHPRIKMAKAFKRDTHIHVFRGTFKVNDATFPLFNRDNSPGQTKNTNIKSFALCANYFHTPCHFKSNIFSELISLKENKKILKRVCRRGKRNDEEKKVRQRRHRSTSYKIGQFSRVAKWKGTFCSIWWQFEKI